ncbi:endonuclease/exonuclease/phosphatase family protein, partial [Solemya velum gill symbiont]
MERQRNKLSNFLLFYSIFIMASYNILQWNCRGYRTQYEELCLLVQEYSPRILCLQESNIDNIKGYSLPSYTSVHQGSVSLLIHNSVPFSTVSLNSEISAIALQVTLHKVFTICSIYLSPNQTYTSTDLIKLLDQLPSPCLLLGDFNGHHPLWGSPAPNARGSQVYQFIDSVNYCLLNLPQPTFLSSSHGTFSHLDLSLAHPSLFLDFTWKVLPDLHGSDHFPILLHCNESIPAPQPTRWKLHSADWKSFENLCNESLLSSANITEFTSELFKIALQTIPRTSGMPAPKRRPWFDTACKAAIAKKKRAFRNFKKSPTSATLEEFRSCRAKARRQLRSSRKLSWKKYVSTLNIHSSSQSVWKTIRSMQGKTSSTIPSHLRDDNSSITGLKEMSNHLGQQFAHNSSSANSSPAFISHRQTQETVPIDFTSSNSENYNALFSLKELDDAISSSHSTCPGTDEIHYSMISHLPHLSRVHLLTLLNDAWTTNTLPPDWRHALVIAIAKPGKDSTQANSYRPISLTSCLCKTFERMINSRLVWTLESQNLLSPLQ